MVINMELLSSPILIGVVATALIGAIAYLFIKRSKSATIVELLRERDRSGEHIEIENDFANTMETSLDRKPVPLFFLKHRGGYAFHEGGHLTRRSYAREVSAYTLDLEQGKIEVPLYKSVISKVGQTFYNQIPEPQRKALEDPLILVTLDFEKETTPPGKEPMSPENVNAQGDETAIRLFIKSKMQAIKSNKGRILDIVMGAAIAAAIIMLAVMEGWIGKPVVVAPQQVQTILQTLKTVT